MRLFTRLSLITALAAVALPVTLSAATVFVSQERSHECGLFGIMCHGHQPYSLTQFENGLIQLPVTGRGDNEFVMVNDTGHTVRLLQFSYFGELGWNTNVACRIGLDMLWDLHSCTVAGDGSSGDGTWWLHGHINPPVEFTYIANSWQIGIPPGAYFDIKAAGFADHGRGQCDRGYLSGTGDGSGSGSGSGSQGPPSQ